MNIKILVIIYLSTYNWVYALRASLWCDEEETVGGTRLKRAPILIWICALCCRSQFGSCSCSRLQVVEPDMVFCFCSPSAFNSVHPTFFIFSAWLLKGLLWVLLSSPTSLAIFVWLLTSTGCLLRRPRSCHSPNGFFFFLFSCKLRSLLCVRMPLNRQLLECGPVWQYQAIVEVTLPFIFIFNENYVCMF